MFSNDDRFGGNARSDAVSGFDAIAAALDAGIELRACPGARLSDVFAIALGWIVLVAAIFYPGLQLLAFVAGIALFSVRSFGRLVFGSQARERDLAVLASAGSEFLRAV